MKKINVKNSVYIIISLIFVVVIIWYFFNNLMVSSIDQENSVKYSGQVIFIKELINVYQEGIFSHKFFKTVKRYGTWPLTIGISGKKNPFYLPLPPEELLLIP